MAPPPVLIRPSCGHSPIRTRLRPYLASPSARCPASPDERVPLDRWMNMAPAARQVKAAPPWRYARSPPVAGGSCAGSILLPAPLGLGARSKRACAQLASRSVGAVTLVSARGLAPQGRRVGGFAACLVTAPPRQGGVVVLMHWRGRHGRRRGLRGSAGNSCGRGSCCCSPRDGRCCCCAPCHGGSRLPEGGTSETRSLPHVG